MSEKILETNATSSETTKETEILPGYTSIEQFTKEGFKVLMEAIRHSNSLPTGRDWNFYKLSDSFSQIMNDEGSNVLRLMNQIMRCNEIESNIRNRVLDEKTELVVEANDIILEKVANNIDEMNGVRKTLPEPVIIQTVSAQLPVNGSWNRPTTAIVTVNSAASEAVGKNCIKLITAKNIIRPQKFFKDKIENDHRHPWCPRIKEKPNSLKPLAIFLEEFENRQDTLRLGCGAYFKLRVCSSGEYLNVHSANLNHTNHDLSKSVFEHLYQNRELNEPELEQVRTYLSLDANKKKIQNKILLETGKRTTLKDLHNIHYKIKIGKNDLQETVELLKTKYFCNVHVLCDEERNFKALQFFTENMKNAMSAWPEFVSVDGTYKLIDIGCTVFLCLVEDSNGQAEIVCVSLLSVEDRDTYHWVFNTFKNEMDTDKIRCFMGDKDMVERDVIKELFPNKPVYLCLFHTLKTFRREINCDKLNITKEERDLSLEYLQKLVYCKNQTEYDIFYTQFKECVPQSVSSYFDKNWHNIRNEWLVYNMIDGNLKNTTNNRMESINHKIKQVVPKNSTLLDFIKNFFIFLNSNNQERDIKAANHILKKSLLQFENHREDMRLYLDLLTNYSFNYVQQQINAMKKVKIINELGNGVFDVTNSNGEIVSVTIESCQCRDFSSMMLPCYHILAVRERSKISLFSKTLCHARWTKEYYLSKQRIGIVNLNTVVEPTCTINERKKIMTLTEKRKAATLVTNSVVNLLSLTSDSEFYYKLEQLKKLEHSWKIGKEVTLEVVNNAQVNEEDDFNNISVEDAHNSDQDGVQILFDGDITDLDIILESNIDTINSSENVRISPTITNAIIKPLTNANNNHEEINISSGDLNCETINNNNNTVIMNSSNQLDTCSKNKNNDIKTIALPPKIKKRGRPKGHELTVVGLKKKRNTTIPTKFVLKSKILQIFYIISIIITDENPLLTYKSFIENQTFQINVDDIKDELPDAVLDSSVVLEDLKKYFTSDAWESFLAKGSEKKKEE